MSINNYEFKVTFKNFSEVDTYRIFKVDNITSLADFGIAIVLSFNGECNHLLQFRSGNQIYNIYNDGYSKDALSAFEHTITELNKKSDFYYDFGDGWEFGIELIKIYDHSGDIIHPQVIEGNGLGFIEDCGGYAGLAKAYKKSPKRFEKFDIKKINQNIDNSIDQIKDELYEHSGFDGINIRN